LDNQQTKFNNLGFASKTGKGFKCVVYSRELSEIKNESMKRMYDDLRQRSIFYVNTILRKNVSDDYFNILEEMDLFDVLKKMWNTLMKTLKLNDFMITVRYSFKQLLISIGLNDDDADEIAKETYLNK
jgi:hypothetical protein